MAKSQAMVEQGVLDGDRYVFPVRVYYEDTDSGGVVYYANYFKFAERARTEMMRSLGVESQKLMSEEGIALAVRHCEADFKKPARLDDLLTVSTRVLGIGGASVDAEQMIACNGTDLVKINLKLACMSLAGGPARMPDTVRATLENFCGNNQQD
ncbi:MAG: YbgC/FadM family acyl-CoA thioesterase [Rhodospirillales bacterium]|jgi:acyl-CoA thioester hydrolase